MPWVTAIILLPLAGALSMLAVPPGGVVQARVHAFLTAGGTLALTAILLGLFDRDTGGPQYEDRHGWATQVGLEWTVNVDGVSIWLITLTSAMFFLAIAYACFRTPDRARGFLGLLLLAEAGLLGLFAAGNLVLFYVFWEAMLVPFYFLIGMWGGSDRVRATTRFVIYTMVGSLLMLVAILGTAFIAREITGQFTFDIEALRGVDFTRNQSIWLFAGFALAFIIKLPLWPFHGWMPGAYRNAPILVTGLLAAVMSKAGVYGLIKIGVPLFPDGAEYFQYHIIVMALAGIAYGSVVAWRQPTVRMLVAYSSLAHLGFVALGIIAFDNEAGQGAVLQMVNHGVVVAAAFTIVGIITERTGKEDIDDIGGLANGAPWLAGVFLIVAMASLAIPGSNAFVGEFFILTGVFRHHWWAAALACIGIAYAAVYMLRLYQSSMNGPRKGVDGSRVEMRLRDTVVLLPLIAAMGLIALWPAAIVGATTKTVERLMAPAQIAVGRPADQIRSSVAENPPAAALPLPGDPVEAQQEVPAQ